MDQLFGLIKPAQTITSSSNVDFMSLNKQLLQAIAKRQAEYQSQKDRLSAARTRYLQKAILIQELRSISQNHRLEDLSLGELAHRCQVADTIQRLQLKSSNSRNLDVTSQTPQDLAGSRTHWLGVTPQDLLSTCDMSRATSQAVVAATSPFLQKSLQQRAARLQQLLTPCNPCPLADTTQQQNNKSSALNVTGVRGGNDVQTKDNRTRTTNDAWRLGDSMELDDFLSVRSPTHATDHTSVTDADDTSSPDQIVRQKLHTLRHHKQAMFLGLQQQVSMAAQLLDCISKTVSSMQTFAIKEIAGRQQKHNEAHVNATYEHTRILSYKVAATQATMLTMTYNSNTVMALNKIHAALQERAIQLDQQLSQVKQLVEAYQALGPEFTAIVSAYGQVRTELNSAQQALNTFTELESELLSRDQFGGMDF